MIKQAQKEDTEQIKRLWRKTFTDSEEKINIFLKNYLDNILVFKIDRKIAGMVSVLPLLSQGQNGGYIYAEAAEDKELYPRLSEYAYKHIRANGGCFAVAAPKSAEERDLYKSLKYSELYAAGTFEYDNVGFPGKDTEIGKIPPEKLFEKRHEFFEGRNFIEWDLKEIEYAWRIYGGNFFEIAENGNKSYAVCRFSEGMLDIKELFGTVDTGESLAALGNLFNAAHIRAAIQSDKYSSAVVYPKKYKNHYFNIAID